MIGRFGNGVDCPCRGCAKRDCGGESNCHDSCEEYRAYKSAVKRADSTEYYKRKRGY